MEKPPFQQVISYLHDLRDSYRGWVKKALQEEVSQHEGKWTESIAACPVKSGCFI
jgi:hypothetical protein